MHTPLNHAFAALLYILAVVGIMYNGELIIGPDDNFFMPVAMISLLVLSVATMAYLFFSQPAFLYFEGKKKEALDFFVSTLGYFAVITVAIFGLVILISPGF